MNLEFYALILAPLVTRKSQPKPLFNVEKVLTPKEISWYLWTGKACLIVQTDLEIWRYDVARRVWISEVADVFSYSPSGGGDKVTASVPA